MASASALRLRIEGMDCGACAVKVENAMQRLPGVADINVSYSAASLSLSLDEDRTSRAAVEASIRALGFTPIDPNGTTVPANHTRPPTAGAGAWWATRKGRLVIGSGTLLALAYAVAVIEPPWSFGIFLAATLAALLPVAHRALAGARAGTPFSIETLLSIAAIGALAIGAAREAAIVVFLFALGELLEGVAAGRARAGIEALVNLVPRSALRLRDTQTETVPVTALAVGDIVVVRPGDRVPSDGTVIDGLSEVDEAPVTG